jgi:predicted nucleotidyltransferase
MENRTINLAVVAEVAQALQHLKQRVVFVGGAVVSLYTDDPAADEVRPTADIDLTVILAGFGEWVRLQEELATLSIYPDPYGPTICRYKLKDIPIDIIPAENSLIGPSNRWYKSGFENLQTMSVHGETIQILSAPCFLATKFEAFKDRGNDYRTSHDIEDIIYVIDNRTTIVDEIAQSPAEIRQFLQKELKSIFQKGLMDEVLAAHIHPLMLEERLPLAQEKINQILSL